MHHEYHRWHSPALGREMALDVVGHQGARVLVFPTSMGTHREWLDRRMHEVLADHIDQGWIQLFLLDHLPDETWYAEHLHPGARAWRFLEYDHYLVSEVLPFTASRNGNPYVIATGASLGGYYAACLGFRHPHLVNRILGMSGTYDVKRLTGGYSDQNVYACNPVGLSSERARPRPARRLPPAGHHPRHRPRRPGLRRQRGRCPPPSGARGSATPCASGMVGRTIGSTGRG